MERSVFLAVLSLVAGFSPFTAPSLVHGEQQFLNTSSPDPNAQFLSHRDQWQNQVTNPKALGLASFADTQGALTDLQGQNDQIRKSIDSAQSQRRTPSNAFVWSDNLGLWKSEPPAATCSLQATSADKFQPC